MTLNMSKPRVPKEFSMYAVPKLQMDPASFDIHFGCFWFQYGCTPSFEASWLVFCLRHRNQLLGSRNFMRKNTICATGGSQTPPELPQTASGLVQPALSDSVIQCMVVSLAWVCLFFGARKMVMFLLLSLSSQPKGPTLRRKNNNTHTLTSFQEYTLYLSGRGRSVSCSFRKLFGWCGSTRFAPNTIKCGSLDSDHQASPGRSDGFRSGRLPPGTWAPIPAPPASLARRPGARRRRRESVASGVGRHVRVSGHQMKTPYGWLSLKGRPPFWWESFTFWG